MKPQDRPFVPHAIGASGALVQLAASADGLVSAEADRRALVSQLSADAGSAIRVARRIADQSNRTARELLEQLR